jgi:DNA-binding CsgD family transcriptional regulator
MLGMSSDACQLHTEQEPLLACFIWRLIEITTVAGARGTGTLATNALNTMSLAAIALDWRGFIIDVNAAADALLDHDVKIQDKRLCVLDLEARELFEASLDELTKPVELKSLIPEPIIVQRRDKLPVILRIWPYERPRHSPEHEVQALVTLNTLEPKPGPPAAILAKTFRLTPSEAKLACVLARGTSLRIAALELKLSWETTRSQLKSIFAKTDTHRQSELVALLLQIQ